MDEKVTEKQEKEGCTLASQGPTEVRQKRDNITAEAEENPGRPNHELIS